MTTTRLILELLARNLYLNTLNDNNIPHVMLWEEEHRAAYNDGYRRGLQEAANELKRAAHTLQPPEQSTAGTPTIP